MIVPGCLSAKRRKTCYPDINEVDRLIRYERMEEGFNELLYERGYDRFVEIPIKNPTPGKRDYREYYSESLCRRFERAFRNELDKFGYTLAGVSPSASVDT